MTSSITVQVRKYIVPQGTQYIDIPKTTIALPGAKYYVVRYPNAVIVLPVPKNSVIEFEFLTKNVPVQLWCKANILYAGADAVSMVNIAANKNITKVISDGICWFIN